MKRQMMLGDFTRSAYPKDPTLWLAHERMRESHAAYRAVRRTYLRARTMANLAECGRVKRILREDCEHVRDVLRAHGRMGG